MLLNVRVGPLWLLCTLPHSSPGSSRFAPKHTKNITHLAQRKYSYSLGSAQAIESPSTTTEQTKKEAKHIELQNLLNQLTRIEEQLGLQQVSAAQLKSLISQLVRSARGLVHNRFDGCI